MTIFELLNKYNFHDSLLEKIEYDEEAEILKVEIDFCNWQQDWYDEIGEETEMISLIFAGVKNVGIPDALLNSDEIIEVNLLDKDGANGIEFVAFNDCENVSHTFRIYAESVDVVKMEL